MKALITGASSGLGWEMATILSEKGYDILAVAKKNRYAEIFFAKRFPFDVLTALTK